MDAINVLSLFDGISCGQVALERVGIPVKNYYASEIDENCIKITQKNYPKTKQLGDVRDLNLTDFVCVPCEDDLIDLIIGGSPCQDLSIAGTRKIKAREMDIAFNKMQIEMEKLLKKELFKC